MKVKILAVPKAKSGIHIKPENKGKFTAYKERTGKTTEEALHSKDPHVRKMAQFAKNARSWKHEDGGDIPEFDYNNQGLQVEDNQFEHLSPHTLKLGGNYHEDGGTDIAYNGTPVEAEADETVHIDQRDDSAVVGGNLYTNALGKKMKYKKAFEYLGKQEAKNDKVRDKAAYLLNNFSPDNKVTAPTFNTGKVMSDAYEQKKMATEADKNYLTDEQNFQLELAEATGNDPKKVNGAIMKAKGGANPDRKIKGFTPYVQPIYEEPVNDTAYSHVYNPSTGQMELVPDVSTPTSQPSYIPSKPKGSGTVADWFASTPRVPTGNRATPAKKKVAPVTHQLPSQQNTTPFRFDQTDPNVDPNAWYYGQRSGIHSFTHHPVDNIEKLPISGPQQLPTESSYKPEEKVVPSLPAYKKPGPDGTEKKHIKGARNKFNPLNYLAEINTFFEGVEPVPSMQVSPFQEPEYEVSLQNKKNQILSAYKSVMEAARRSPAQQAALAGQMAEQLASVDSEELIMNQQNRGNIRGRNIQELQKVRDINTQLAQQQMDRQQQAKAITMENRHQAAQSLAAKEAQREMYNNKMAMREDYTGWVYDPKQGKYQMTHPGYQGFDWQTSSPDMEPTEKAKKKKKQYYYDDNGELQEARFGGYIASRKPSSRKSMKKGSYC